MPLPCLTFVQPGIQNWCKEGVGVWQSVTRGQGHDVLVWVYAARLKAGVTHKVEGWLDHEILLGVAPLHNQLAVVGAATRIVAVKPW